MEKRKIAAVIYTDRQVVDLYKDNEFNENSKRSCSLRDYEILKNSMRDVEFVEKTDMSLGPRAN